MRSLIVMRGVTPIYSSKSDYILIDTKDFTLDWCYKNIAGMQLPNIEIWESEDSHATAYALSRSRSPHGISVLLTKSVWKSLESLYKTGNLEQKHIDAIKASCNIVEDLK
ncbi:hypothetical protein MVUOKPPV_CDS0088 [Klebsiella phage phi1_175008]|uniref:Uncharacterized protein n=2 Tax=Klebsiella phage phi1_175008 TaxID=3127744 RepID=A0AC61ZSZ0_9CAUD